MRPSSDRIRSVPSAAGGGGGLSGLASFFDSRLGFGDFSFITLMVRMVSHVDTFLVWWGGSPTGDEGLAADCVVVGSGDGGGIVPVLERKLSRAGFVGLD